MIINNILFTKNRGRMSTNDSEKLSLTDIYDLAFNVFINNGCNKNNASALAKIVHDAERMDPYHMVYLGYLVT